jgi:ElaB/YqjD/DUF883 family membrane-anchored ribosome-binding protein
VLTSTLKEIAAQQGGAAYETVQRSAKKAQEKAAQSVGAVGHEIGEKPFISMLSTFSVGLLIGMLFGRRI